MSEALEQVVDRAVKDASYRQLLLNNPDEALKGYAVTGEERQLLANLTDATFDEFAGSLGDRTTKGFLPGTG
ncbi:MAG TPA: Os1348 family NHLP clan protein [Chloroflexota bacterium]|nr:Os1348 family NHLP clan protein [Chloroflexota bacterium]HUM71445.1 Os1348 family NHLP clan protein [Chloroflexota bacterium]